MEDESERVDDVRDVRMMRGKRQRQADGNDCSEASGEHSNSLECYYTYTHIQTILQRYCGK